MLVITACKLTLAGPPVREGGNGEHNPKTSPKTS